MTRQSAALFSGLGEGMITMGGEVQNVFNAERANKAEEIKAQRLASMQQSEHMMSNLFKLDTSRTQKSQFAAQEARATSEFDRTMTEQEAARRTADEANKLQREQNLLLDQQRIDLTGERLAHDIQRDLASLTIQQARVQIEKQSLEQAKDQFDKTLAFKFKQLFETASVNRFNEAMAEKNYDQAERELEFRREQFGHTKDVDKLKIALQEQSLALQSKTLDSEIAYRASQIDLANKRLEHDERSVQDKLAHAREELSFKKLSFDEEMAWKEADRSEKMALARAQFDHLQVSDERKDELARDRFDYLQKSDDQKHQFLLKKFEFEKLSTKEREKIEREKIAISKDLATLEEEKESRAIARDKQVEWYEKAIVGIKKSEHNLAKKRVKIEERKLVLTEDASERDKWKITTIPEYGWVDADDPQVDDPTYEKIGERIVLINLDEPELQDVRMLTDDGRWEGGSPDGWRSYTQEGVDAVRAVMAKDNVSFTEAVAVIKEINEQAFQDGRLKKKDNYDWDSLLDLVLEANYDDDASIEGVVPKGTTTTVAPEFTDTNRQVSESTRIHRENIQNTPEDKRIETLQAWREDYAKYGLTSDVAAIDVLLSELGVTPNASGIVTGDDTGVITSKGPIHDASEAVEDTGPTWVPGPRGIGGKWVED